MPVPQKKLVVSHKDQRAPSIEVIIQVKGKMFLISKKILEIPICGQIYRKALVH
jgi:hypothetical protein